MHWLFLYSLLVLLPFPVNCSEQRDKHKRTIFTYIPIFPELIEIIRQYLNAWEKITARPGPLFSSNGYGYSHDASPKVSPDETLEAIIRNKTIYLKALPKRDFAWSKTYELEKPTLISFSPLGKFLAAFDNNTVILYESKPPFLELQQFKLKAKIIALMFTQTGESFFIKVADQELNAILFENRAINCELKKSNVKSCTIL